MKIIVIGTNHAGTTAVRTLRRLDPNVDIITYDMSDNISFLGCGIPLWIQGEITSPKDLFYATPMSLAKENITVKMRHEWIFIDERRKIITLKNLATNVLVEDYYDKLIVATGSWPLQPNVKESNLKNIEICKNFNHGELLFEATKDIAVKNVTIIGAGYIGIEMAEAFAKAGKKVTIMDTNQNILYKNYDPEISDLIATEMNAKGIKIMLNEELVLFNGDAKGDVKEVVTKNSKIETDYVIMAAGIKYNTKQLEDVLDLNEKGAIITNEFMQTSNKDIYAIGDCAEVYSAALQENCEINLATTAIRSGIVAATNIILGNATEMNSFTGSNALSIFGLNISGVGLTERSAIKNGFEVDTVFFVDSDRPEFTESYEKIHFKIIWDKLTRRILGAQLASKDNHTEAMHVMALAIQKEVTIDELPFTDILFLPHFNKPFGFIIMAALQAMDINYFKN